VRIGIAWESWAQIHEFPYHPTKQGQDDEIDEIDRYWAKDDQYHFSTKECHAVDIIVNRMFWDLGSVLCKFIFTDV
jgi:hypothetical protein